MLIFDSIAISHLLCCDYTIRLGRRVALGEGGVSRVSEVKDHSTFTWFVCVFVHTKVASGSSEKLEIENSLVTTTIALFFFFELENYKLLIFFNSNGSIVSFYEFEKKIVLKSPGINSTTATYIVRMWCENCKISLVSHSFLSLNFQSFIHSHSQENCALFRVTRVVKWAMTIYSCNLLHEHAKSRGQNYH